MVQRAVLRSRFDVLCGHVFSSYIWGITETKHRQDVKHSDRYGWVWRSGGGGFASDFTDREFTHPHLPHVVGRTIPRYRSSFNYGWGTAASPTDNARQQQQSGTGPKKNQGTRLGYVAITHEYIRVSSKKSSLPIVRRVGYSPATLQ
jgi:hypothetical protein